MARKISDLGELAIAIALKTQALEQGMKEVQKQLRKHGNDVQETGRNYDKLAIVAGLAFWKISSAIRGGVDAFNEFNNSMVGLKSIVQGTGNDFSKAQKFIDEFIADGLVPASNAATALKNLLSRGFGFNQAAEIMNRFKDSASFARQGSLSMGQAIQGATEGLKNSNSVMVDNAGVTENLSVMWDKYAQQIGKTVGQLTEAEKVQAEYVGILRATQNQVGDAAKYSKEFAGAQARNTAETLKLKQAFGESLIPVLNELLSLITPIISGLTQLVKANPELVAAITITVTAFLGIVTAITAVGTAINILRPALAALNVSLTGLMANPVVLALTAIATVASLVAINMNKAKREQEEYNNAVQRYNKIKTDGITKAEVPQFKEEVKQLEELVVKYDELMEAVEKYKEEYNDASLYGYALSAAQEKVGTSFKELTQGFRKFGLEVTYYNNNINEAKDRLKELNQAIFEAERVTATEYNEMTKNIVLKRQSVEETRNLIDSYKSATKGSKEYYDAQQKLAEIFPQFSTASGIQIDAIERVVKAQDDAVKAEWNMLQAKIRMTMIDIERIKTQRQETLRMLEDQKKVLQQQEELFNNTVRLPSPAQKLLPGMNEQIEKQRNLINGLNSDYKNLGDLLNTSWDQITGVKPLNNTSGTGNNNSLYEQALRLLEHRKRLNQLALEDEVKTLEEIKKKYAKSADDKMDIEERIFNTKQEIIARDKKAQEEALEAQLKMFQRQEEELRQRTTNSTRWIDRKKLYNELTENEEIQAYERIIKYHKEYLNKIMADEKISQEEKQRIREQEIDFIEDQEDKIYSIKKSYIEKSVKEYVDTKRRQLDAEESAENERLNAKLKAVDKEYSDKEAIERATELSDQLKQLKAEEIKYMNAQTKDGKEKLKSIQDEISKVNLEIEKERINKEKESRKEAIQEEIESNRNKYKSLREELEKSQQEMLAASAEYAKALEPAFSKASKSLTDALSNMFKSWQNQNDILMKAGLERLQKFINDYKNKMAELQLGFVAQGLNIAGFNTARVGSNIILNVNDNGDKIINSKDETIDYTKELFNTAKNSVRSIGGGF